MQWKKLGIVWKPSGTESWASSHGMCPTPWLMNDQVIRVFITCLDARGRGRVGFVDLDSDDPTKVVGTSPGPVLDIGEPGAFDDNGVTALGVVCPEPGILYLYYAGFELCAQVRYRIFTGLAISRDNGASFVRYSRSPVLDRSDQELYFRCGPFVQHSEGRFKLWYIAGSQWTNIRGKDMPVYDLRYQESINGFHWAAAGRVLLKIEAEDEHGFGRPWIVQRGPGDYQMFYSIRRRSLGAYRLGYAQSTDGLNWTRMDQDLGLDVTPGAFDSAAIMYSAVVDVSGRTYCFYNGNNFGEDGFAVAEMLP